MAFLNCVDLAIRQCREKPDATALWLPGNRAGSSTSFAELEDLARRTQKLLLHNGLHQGEVVLLMDELGPRLYAVVMAVLAMGASIMLVEPWMPIANIEHAVKAAQPKIFLSNFPGKVWGLRIPAIRHIRRWLSPSSINKVTGAAPLQIVSVDPDQPAILTFTSGTTGRPKGVVRNQGTLLNQHTILDRALAADHRSGPDLCIFANFVLNNLASGRCSLIIPPKWKGTHLKQLDQLPKPLKPETLTCGPGFLLTLMSKASLPTLRSVNIGGALTDCWIFEKGFEKWPDSDWSHIYGTTEAEPVAVCDARVAVKNSRKRHLFQTLYLGKPIDNIETEIGPDGLWVTGAHVCPHYLGNAEENRLNKKEDDQGRVWHFMGDRVRILDASEGGWWFSGRASQALEDFELEQYIYMKLQSSKTFLHRHGNDELYLLGEDVGSLSLQDDEALRCIKQALELRIYRDHRHRARIDRTKSVEKGAKWLLG